MAPARDRPRPRPTIAPKLDAVRIIAALCAAVSLCIACDGARAQPWPQLPDGRIVLTVKGTRIALPNEPVLFDHAGVYQRGGVYVKLREVIEQPERYRNWLAETPQEVSFGFNVGWGMPEARSPPPEVLLRQPWRGQMSLAILNEVRETRLPDGTVSRWPRRDHTCNVIKRQGFTYAYRNITDELPGYERLSPRRTFQSCAGPVSISYTLVSSRFPASSLRLVQERLVAFFQSIILDHPVEIYP